MSFLSFGKEVKGVTLKGFKYNLDDFDCVESRFASLGISNEVKENEAYIEIKEGKMLMIETGD